MIQYMKGHGNHEFTFNFHFERHHFRVNFTIFHFSLNTNLGDVGFLFLIEYVGELSCQE